MFNRKELKTNGKKALGTNYLSCVLVSLMGTIILGGTAGAAFKTGAASQHIELTVQSLQAQEQTVLISFAAFVLLITVLISTFIRDPFEVGRASFYLKNTSDKAKITAMLDGFRNSYLRNVGTLFIRNLLIALGSIVVIPGIILTYSYRLVPFILADHPEMDGKTVRKMSAEMMRGNKWKAFILDLSFIGWDLLGAVTCGLAFLLWTTPYHDAVNAELYISLRK